MKSWSGTATGMGRGTDMSSLCVDCKRPYGEHSREPLTTENPHNWAWQEHACPVGDGPFHPTQVFSHGGGFQSACSECNGDGCAKCCHGCAQRDEHILKLERAITSAIDTIPNSMGGDVTLGLNILQAVQREFLCDE